MSGIALLTLSTVTFEHEAHVRVKGTLSLTLPDLPVISGAGKVMFILTPKAQVRETKPSSLPRVISPSRLSRVIMVVPQVI